MSLANIAHIILLEMVYELFAIVLPVAAFTVVAPLTRAPTTAPAKMVEQVIPGGSIVVTLWALVMASGAFACAA